VLVPERVKELSFREFLIVIARAGGQFIAVGRDRSGMQVARAHGSAIDEVEADLKSRLLKLSNDFVDVPGAINLFRRAHSQAASTARSLITRSANTKPTQRRTCKRRSPRSA